MTNFIHLFIKTYICLYKWIEFKVLSLFSRFVEHSVIRKLEQIGVVIESPKIGKNNYSENYSKILKQCKYDKVCRLQLKNKRLLTQIANLGYIAMGEGYVNGDFTFTDDENDITEFVSRCLSNNYYQYYFNIWNSMLHNLEFECVNLQTCSRAWEVGKRHYDLGNLSS